MKRGTKKSLVWWAGFSALVLGITVFAFGCKPSATKTEKVSGKRPSFVLMAPQNGATEAGPNIIIKISVKDLKLVPPGMAPQAGEGHIHYMLDSDLQMSAEQTVTFTGVKPGEHTIKVMLVQNDHTLFEPSVEKTIKIKVGSGGGAQSTSPANPPTPPGY